MASVYQIRELITETTTGTASNTEVGVRGDAVTVRRILDYAIRCGWSLMVRRRPT